MKIGDRVRKKTGSHWQGRIVGTYSTKLTQEGYAVESEFHPGSVQIYPAAALEIVKDLDFVLSRNPKLNVKNLSDIGE